MRVAVGVRRAEVVEGAPYQATQRAEWCGPTHRVQRGRGPLQVEELANDCAISEAASHELTTPQQVVSGRLVAALRFADPRVLALVSALVVFRLLPTGSSKRDMRGLLARLLGIAPSTMHPAEGGDRAEVFELAHAVCSRCL
jgi:hypothetical protein